MQYDKNLEIALMISKLVNSNLGLESSFPVIVASRPATQTSKQTAKATTKNKTKVSPLNLNFSLQAWNMARA